MIDTTTSADTCRLSVISGTLRADLAVPRELSVAELLTVVVTGLGPSAADRGVGEGGWILQRTGALPLSPAATLATGGVVDGDVLHLRTRATERPAVVFDDVADAVADGVRTRTRRWTPAHTACAAVNFAGTLLVLAALGALSVGPGWGASSVLLGIGAALLGLTAVMVGRIARRRGPALTAAGLAVGYAAGCGATALGGDRALVDFGATQLLGAAGAAALSALVLLAALSDGVAGFVALATAALLGGLGMGAAVALDLGPAATGAAVAALGLTMSCLVPTLSLRLSGLVLPVVTLDPSVDLADPGQDPDPDALDTLRVQGQAVRADRCLTGLVGGTALAISASAVLLAGRGGWADVLSATLGAVCLLRGRLFTGRGQRSALLIAGGVAVAAAAVAAALETSGTVRLLVGSVPAVTIGVALVWLALTLPGRRYAPPMARAADVAESALLLAAMPLILAVLGVYGAVRR